MRSGRHLRAVGGAAPERDARLSWSGRVAGWLRQHTGLVLTLAGIGMVGFVGACVALMAGALELETHLLLAAASLVAYSAGLGAGYLGDSAGSPRPR